MEKDNYITNEEIIRELIKFIDIQFKNNNEKFSLITINNCRKKYDKQSWENFEEAYQAAYEMLFNENDY